MPNHIGSLEKNIIFLDDLNIKDIHQLNDNL
jgi:hypothetical protein